MTQADVMLCLGSRARESRVPQSNGRKVMAYGIVHHFPGGTKAQYEASIAAVHPSRESWERFRDDILMPRMQLGIDGGFPTPPVETAIDVQHLLP